jgi:predicted DNA repair protein MutK
MDVIALEKEKIAGAVRTDFILSAEIVVITLGTVAQEPFPVQVGVLMGISLIMTVGVYGLVAGIVKLDDLGLYLNRQKDQFKQTFGKYILIFAPYLMKTLSVVGTAAMFLVGGGIIAHGISVIHKSIEELAHGLKEIATIGPVLEAITPTLLEGLLGMVVGAIVVAVVTFAGRTLKPAKT